MSRKGEWTSQVRVRRASSPDVERILEAAEVFDRPPDREAVGEFLARDDHHLLIAYIDGEAAGFALAHELPRLDGAQPKLLLYEIGVAPRFRQRGVGRGLIEAMKQVGRQRGAQCMFAVTEESNTAAMALYAASGAVRRALDEAVVEFPL